MATTGTPLSAVEVALSYGGDYELTPSGDLAVVQDTPYNPAATIQRVTFLVMTNPAMPNATGTAVGEPDDIFNPTYGSGARAYVGRTNAPANLDAVERNILNALASDPFIAQTPRPTVTFTASSDSIVLCTVAFAAVTGQNVTIPDLPIKGGAS